MLEAPPSGEADPSASAGRPLSGRVGWAIAALLALAVAALAGVLHAYLATAAPPLDDLLRVRRRHRSSAWQFAISPTAGASSS